MSITKVASGVLAGGTGNKIECDALNAEYENVNDVSDTFSFKGFMNSTAHDVFAGKLGDNPSDGGRFEPSSANDSVGSVKYTISSSPSTTADSLNDDDYTPASFASSSSTIFKRYIYKSTDATYAKYNYLDPGAIPSRDYHTFEGYYTTASNNSGAKIFTGVPTSGTTPEVGSYNTALTDEEISSITEKSITLYAHWKARKLTVSFHKNHENATGTMSDIEVDYGVPYTKVENGTEKGLPDNTFSRSGYTFKGWKKQNSSDIIADGSKTAVFYGDTTLYAYWGDPNEYTIAYNNNGGTGTISDQKETFETKNRSLSNGAGFEKKGFDLIGWSTKPDPTASDTIYKTTDTVNKVLTDNPPAGLTDPYAPRSEKITLYAIWKVGRYLINYNDERYNPNTVSKERTCGDFTKLDDRDDIEGYTFEGWSESYGGSATYKKGQSLTKDLTNKDETINLYAVYRPHTYKIHFIKSNGDEGPDTDQYADGVYDSNTTLNDNTYYGITRKGHKFIGWNKSSSSTTPSEKILPANSSDALINSSVDYKGPFPKSVRNLASADGANIYVYPVWQKETYTIHYQGDGTTTLSDKTYEYGNTITLPTLTMANKTFKGWMESDTQYNPGATIDTKNEGIARNLTFTAIWDNDHFITISPDSFIKTITAKINGVQKTLVSNGTLASLTFKGGEEFTDITITSVDNQLIKSYSVTSSSGASLGTTTFSKAASTITIPGPIKFPTGANMNISITPEAQTYKLTFNTNGGTIIGTTPTSYTYGQGLDLPTYVVKDGTKFYGWKNSLGSIVTSISKTQSGDLTFTAVWSDPNVTDLPQGASAATTPNGKYVIITYANKTTEDVNIAAQGIALKAGSNTIQFKTADGKTYLTAVTYTAPTDLPSTIKANYVTGAATATITYSDGTTQSVAVNKYNSETTLSGTKIYFDGIDGKRYATIPSANADPTPTPSASPSPTDSGTNQKPQPDEYYMISKVSYNVRSGKASATNPYDWNATSITVKPTVKIYGKSYKVTKISAEAFYGMQKLKTLIIGKNVKSIGANAARDCKKLKTIKIMSGNITSMGKNWLKNIAKNAYVYIKASKKKYKKLRDLTRKKSGCPKSTHFRRLT